MDFTDWLLALHLLAAACLVAALVIFSVLIVASWKTDVPNSIARMMSVAKAGTVIIGIGSIGVIVLGVWLAIDLDRYKVWDGWVLAAIVLWAISVETGRRSGKLYTAAGGRAQELVSAGNDAPNSELGAMMRSSAALGFHIATAALVFLILLDMIWKPGA
jgi:uncharacterized membrane protein